MRRVSGMSQVEAQLMNKRLTNLMAILDNDLTVLRSTFALAGILKDIWAEVVQMSDEIDSVDQGLHDLEDEIKTPTAA